MKFIKTLPYFLSLAYLIYVLSTIELSIKQHLDVRAVIMLPFVLAVVVSIFKFVDGKIKNKQNNYWFPVFLICIGVIVVLFSSNITCCSEC